MLRLKLGHSDGVVDNLYNCLIGRSNNVSFENHVLPCVLCTIHRKRVLGVAGVGVANLL